MIFTAISLVIILSAAHSKYIIEFVDNSFAADIDIVENTDVVPTAQDLAATGGSMNLAEVAGIPGRAHYSFHT